LYKKHGSKVLSSFSYIFRPVFLSRISPFFFAVFGALAFCVWVAWTFGPVSLAGVFLAAVAAHFLFFYRFCVIFNPD
jgi:hypothetical protein